MPHRATDPAHPEQLDLGDPASYRDAGLSCDLIMKGGITSGVVYPQATCRLATRYRLRRLGGASAGAIAAALGAAAEHHRQHGDPDDAPGTAGFVALAAVPTDLGKNLGSLFQPVRSTRPALSLLMAALAPGRGVLARTALTVARLVQVAPVVFVGTLLATLLPSVLSVWSSRGELVPAGWRSLLLPVLAWLPGGLLLALLASALRVLLRTARGLQGNGFGLSNGHTTDGRAAVPPLTDWMAATIDATAGLPEGPLTFGHLWGEQASAVHRDLRRRRQARERLTSQDWRRFQPDVDLKVMTTNLTLRKPFEFPFSQDGFYYCPACWQLYFPASVLAHLERTSAAAPARLTIRSRSGAQEVAMVCPRHPGAGPVRQLPDAPDLPVVVAARLSLSFPLLVSAVPLLCVDFSRAAGRRRLVVTWFSDGGIASNFPIHFFDAPLPSRPTFGISLDQQHPDYPDEMVWRPQRTLSGVFPRTYELSSVLAFVTSVVRTMQNWVDASQLTMPGYRDRVTELRTRPGEGGLNLRMDDALVRTLAERGSEAARQFEDFDFSLHRWVRYRAIMNSLSECLDSMHARWPGAPGEEGYAELVTRYAGTPGTYRLDPQDAVADAEATRLLMAVAAQWQAAGYPATAPEVPQPQPRLRQMPPL